MATRRDEAPLQENPNSKVIGIHLGGSSFCVSLWDAAHGWVRVLRAPSPSVVTYLGEREVVGERKRQIRNPKESVTNCRWMLGRPYTELQTQLDRWSCALLRDKQDRALLDVKSDGNRISARSSEQIYAAILREVKSAAQKAGGECRMAVITAPPGFTEEQRRAMEKSLSLAGLSAVHIIPEQEAAALSYTLHPETAVVDNTETWMLFRVGGSSSFASVVQVSPAAYPEVLGTRHDHTLGGALITQRLISLLPAQWRETVSSPCLYAIAEKAKIKFSIWKTVSIWHPTDNEEIDISYEQLRTECYDLWWKWQELITKVMSEVKVTVDQIDKVILVGAASKTPHFKDMVEFTFPGKLLSSIIPVEEILSHGAAIKGAILNDKLEIKPPGSAEANINENWVEKESHVLKSYMTLVLAKKKNQQQEKLLVLCEKAKKNFCTSMELRVSESHTADQIGEAVKEILKSVLETFKKEANDCSREVKIPFVKEIHQYSQCESQRYLAVLTEKDTSVEKDEYGESALHRAAREGKTEAVQLLLEQGADPEARDKNNGWTPLHGAACYGHIPVVRILAEQGCKVNEKCKNGSTPLHWAAYKGKVETVRLLAQFDADVSVGNNTKNTPLHLAVHSGGIKTVSLLLDLGARMNEKDDDGDTPLHKAALHNKMDSARELVERGADTNARNLEGKTPLAVAREYENSELTEFLQSRDVAEQSILSSLVSFMFGQLT